MTIECSNTISSTWTQNLNSSINNTIVNQHKNQEKTDKIGEDISKISGLWQLKKTEDGIEYLYTKYDVLTALDFTSFSIGKEKRFPSIYDGLEIDNQTIVWEVVNGVKTLVAKGGGSGEGTIKDVVVNVEGNANAITNVTLNANKTGLVFTKGLEFAERKYLDDNFYNKKWIDEYYVTLNTPQTISGEKNFTGGLLVKGHEIEWDERGFWKLDGDLLVTGGITAFADRYDPTSIMDAIVTDEQTITVEDINGVKTLKVIGGADKGVKVELVASADQATEADTLYIIV
jgi:hypothetical protein